MANKIIKSNSTAKCIFLEPTVIIILHQEKINAWLITRQPQKPMDFSILDNMHEKIVKKLKIVKNMLRFKKY